MPIQTDQQKDLPVIFRKWTKDIAPDESVIALFPTLWEGGMNCTSYEHIGQHGAATVSTVMAGTHPAKPEEYADLLKELQEIYEIVEPEEQSYRLKVYKREQGWMRDVRRNEMRAARTQ